MRSKYIITGFLLLLIFSSCEKVIDQIPVSDVTRDNFWQTQSDAEAGLTAVYNQLQAISSTSLYQLSLRADEAITPDYYGWNIQNPSIHDFQNNIVAPTDGFANWAAFYNGIARANNVLTYVPEMDFTQSDKDRIVGEVYFLRAYFYFILTLNWGDVPLVTAPYTTVSDDMKVPRNPREEVYAQIIDDLNNADMLLPVQQPNAQKNLIRANKMSAEALLCNVYLTRGYQSFGSTDDFQKAADFANTIINSGYYQLESGNNYRNIFSKSGSKEVIMEVKYDYTISETNGLCLMFLPRSYSENRGWGGDANVLPTKLITDEHETGDLRTDVNFQTVPDPAVNYDHELAGMPYVAKYPGTVVQEGVIRYGDSPWILFRLSDVILMRAEALVKMDHAGDAADLVNVIRNRAGLPNTTASSNEDVADAIQQERLYELCFEGKRWYDLIRTGLINEVKPDFIGKILLPVPQSDIDRNPNLLPQNPGY
jgi:hypothetical protein